ncbi:hypothetical protein [Lewinella sp. W8]|uniref:hypothetical protein n=1 Tax=Lewinella sp. W8 TaxID=2528208 RepID=UPI0010674FE8|nr:hypothetical protein [Lewinella sp. W8]MTB50979.1 hypothetical protein [Lewinella sp. W8]
MDFILGVLLLLFGGYHLYDLIKKQRAAGTDTDWKALAPGILALVCGAALLIIQINKIVNLPG